MDCSLSGSSSIHGIFQARGLEWGALAFFFLPLGFLERSLDYDSNNARAREALKKLQAAE